MAEGEKEQSQGWGGAGWFSGLIAAAKEQTEKVFEVVSNDLTEFTTTMQQDTKKVVEKTKETLQQASENENKSATDMMKQSFHSLMTGITKVLTVDPDESVATEKKSPRETSELFDRAKARRRAVQVDTGTYLNEPAGPPEKYADWLKSFDLDKHKGEISDLLVTMVEVRSLYTSLVPSQVSHQDFWRRYFYKLHQLEVDEARKQALMKRAERANVKEDSVGWDEEEWSGDESGNSSPGKDNNSKSKEEGDINQVGADSRLLPNIEQDTNASVKTENGKDTTNKTKQKPDDSRIDSNVKQKEASSERDLGNTETKVKTHIQTEDQAKDVIKEKRNVEALSKGSDAINESVTDNTEQDDQPIDKPVDKCESSRTDVMQKLTEKDCDKIVEDHAKITATEETLGEKSKAEKGGDVASNERKLKTSVKGDMVVVKDRESPSSESSGNKESINDDWEQDFDVEITPEDLAAASELAQKMNMTASDYNTITGGEDDDWENWD